MKFSDAMEKLKSNSKVTREPWENELYFKIVDNEVRSFQQKLVPYQYNEDIIISEGWLLDGLDGEFTFGNIIPYLMDGMKAKLKNWNDSFIYYDHPSKFLVCQSMEIFPFNIDFQSFTSEDWIEIK